MCILNWTIHVHNVCCPMGKVVLQDHLCIRPANGSLHKMIPGPIQSTRRMSFVQGWLTRWRQQILFMDTEGTPVPSLLWHHRCHCCSIMVAFVKISICIIWRYSKIPIRDTSRKPLAWCRQATRNHLSQCWPRSLSPYGVAMPQMCSIKLTLN